MGIEIDPGMENKFAGAVTFVYHGAEIMEEDQIEFAVSVEVRGRDFSMVM
jgi:hypothetical protein